MSDRASGASAAHRRTSWSSSGLQSRWYSFPTGSILLKADPRPQPVRDSDQYDERQHHDDTQRRQHGELPVLELFENEDRKHFIARAVQQDPTRQLPE